MLPCEVLYAYDNKLMVKEVRNDTLYRLSGSDTFEPGYIFNFSELKMPLEEFTYESFAKRHFGGKYAYFLKVVENKNNLFFTYKHRGDDVHWVYSKTSEKLYNYSSSLEYSRIPDDIKSGPGFWPVSQVEDNHMLGYLEPSSLTEQKLKSLSDIVGKLDISANPVVQIVSY